MLDNFKSFDTNGSNNLEPVVLIDKAKNKEAHVIVPSNYTFDDLMQTAKRINPDLFEGDWDLSYINPDTKNNAAIDSSACVGDFLVKGIDTFYWRYVKKGISWNLRSDQQSAVWQDRNNPNTQRRQESWKQQNRIDWHLPSDRQGQPQQQPINEQGYTIHYGSRTKRIFAAFIDIMLLSILLSFASAGGWASIFLSALYFIASESSTFQATPGKVILGLRVTDLQGRRLSFRAAAIRFALKLVASFFFVVAFATERKQALHDLVAQSMVVEAPRNPINTHK